jgi:hypothetical protein
MRTWDYGKCSYDLALLFTDISAKASFAALSISSFVISFYELPLPIYDQMDLLADHTCLAKKHPSKA